MDLPRRLLLGLALALLGLSPGLGVAALAHSHSRNMLACGEFDTAAETCAGLSAARTEAPCPVCQALNGLQRLAGPATAFEASGPSLERSVRPKPWLPASDAAGRAHGARAPPFPA